MSYFCLPDQYNDYYIILTSFYELIRSKFTIHACKRQLLRFNTMPRNLLPQNLLNNTHKAEFLYS